MSATFNKFNAFANNLADGACDLGADTLNVMLVTPTAPPLAAASVYSDIAGQEVAFGNGYATGGFACVRNSSGQISGLYKLVLNDLTFTASGALGPFRYLVLYSLNVSVVPKPLIGWWDYGSPITLSEGEPFTIAFDPSLGVVTIQ